MIGPRIVWSIIILALFIIFRWQFSDFRRAVMNRRTFLLYFAAATLMGTNWLAYVWTVKPSLIIEACMDVLYNYLPVEGYGFLYIGIAFA